MLRGILILLLIFNFCFAQEKISISLDKKLPSTKIYGIEKQNGKLLFFTPKGFSIYNGKNHQTYNSKNGLKNDDIFNSYTDSKGRIWLYVKSKKIPYIFNEEVHYLDHQLNDLYYWIKEQDELLMVCSSNKLLKFNINNLKLTDSIFFKETILGIDDKNRVITYDGFYDIDGVLLKKHVNNIIDNGYTLRHKLANFSDLYNYTTNELHRYYFNKIDTVKFNDKILNIEYEESVKKLVVSEQNHYKLYNINGKPTNTFNQELSQINHSKHIELFLDSNENLYISNVSNEIVLFPYYRNYINEINFDTKKQNATCFVPYQKGFLIGNENGEIIFIDSSGKTSLTNNIKESVKALKQVGNYLVIAGSENIFTTSLQDTKTTNYLSKNFAPKSITERENKFYILGFLQILALKPEGNNYSFSIHEIKGFNPTSGLQLNDSSWLLSDKNNLVNYNVNSKESTPYNYQSISFINNFLGDIVLASNYNIIHGKNINSLTDTIMFNERISGIHTTDKNLIIGTDKGIFILDSNYKKQLILDKERGIKDDRIIDVKSDKDNIYILTQSTIITLKKTVFKHKLIAPKINQITFAVNKGKNSNIFSSFYRNINIKIDGQGYIDPLGFDVYYRLPSKSKNWIKAPDENFDIELNEPFEGFIEVKLKSFNIESNIYKQKLTVTPSFLESTFGKVLIAILCLIILVLLNVVIVKRIINKKKERQVLENKLLFTEIENLQARMNPHFLYNSLDSFQSLFFYKDKIEANVFLGDFAKLLRKFLEYTKLSLVSVHTEIDLIENYLRVESKRFSEKFDYTISVDSDVEQYQIPTLLVQPTVENAILHGISNTKEKGKIEVIFNLNEDKTLIIIKIIDNGIGINEATERKNIKSKHTSLALKMIEDKIKTIKIISKKDIEFTILDRKETGERGTIATFKIPSDLWKNWQS